MPIFKPEQLCCDRMLRSIPSKSQIFLLGALILTGSCITEEQAARFRPGTRSSREALRPDDFQIQPNYTDEERAVPIMLAPLPDVVPQVFILSDLPPAGNQMRQASGVAFSTGYLATSYYHRRRGKPGYTCSPSFVYNSLNGGKDEGISVLDALDFLHARGCPTEQLMPFNEKDFFRKPGPDALQNADAFRVRGYSRIDFRDFDQVHAHLLQGSVLIVSMKITENFVDLREPLWTPAGKFVAIHTVGVIGYDITRQEVLIQNSAGGTWGHFGTARMPWIWFQRLTEKAFVLF